MDLKFDYRSFRVGTIVKLWTGTLSSCYMISACDVMESGVVRHSIRNPPEIGYIETLVAFELEELNTEVESAWQITEDPMHPQILYINGLAYLVRAAELVMSTHQTPGDAQVKKVELQRAYWKDNEVEVI